MILLVFAIAGNWAAQLLAQGSAEISAGMEQEGAVPTSDAANARNDSIETRGDISPDLNSNIYVPVVTTDSEFARATATAAPQAENNRTDWPQYQHDASRTGYNPSTAVPRSFGETWSRGFPGDGISSTAQPIVFETSVFLGTERGVFYAFHIHTGKALWERQLDGPVVHTAAANQRAVFAATLSGSAYALDRSNGATLWEVNTDASFGSAVLLVDALDRLYVTDRMGRVYSLDTITGEEIWQTDLGFPVFQSPSYGNGRVYIGAEDLKLYALDAADGQILWTSKQFYGRSFHDYAPVYAQGLIWVNTSMAPYTRSKNNGELLRQACVDASDTKILEDSQSATLEWLRLNPKSQTSYVLDASTGDEPYVPGVLFSNANSGAQPPPIYAGGRLFTGFHAQGVPWWWIGGSLGALGVVDIATGRVVERLARSPGEFTLDETNNYSRAGDVLLGARCQEAPSCVVVGDPAGGCGIHVGASARPFTADLCLPGAAPIYAKGHVVYQTRDVLTVY